MKTKYIGIESIFVIDKELATIACNIMFEGKLYDEPIYTNIFCSYIQLKHFLNLATSPLGKKILIDIEAQSIISEDEQIEIHLPPYINNKIEWDFETMVALNISKNDNIPFECYTFAVNKEQQLIT